MLRIVIAGPDEVLTDWLAAAIAPVPEFELVGTALDGEKALEVVCDRRPDVVLVDADIVMSPQGDQTLVAAIAEAVPATLVFVLASEACEKTAQALIAAGATGVVAKNGSAQILGDGWSEPEQG